MQIFNYIALRINNNYKYNLGGGKKILDLIMETGLANWWITEVNKNNTKISRK